MLGYAQITPPFETEYTVKERMENPWSPRLLTVTQDVVDQRGQEIKDSASWCGDCHSSTCQSGGPKIKTKPQAQPINFIDNPAADITTYQAFGNGRCPTRDRIQEWLKQAAIGNTRESYRINSDTNDIGDITGPACPADKLCQSEDGCMIIQSGRKAPHISLSQRSVYEEAWEKGWVKPIERLHDTFNNVTTVNGAERLQVAMIGTGVAVHEPMKVFLQHGADVTAYDGKDVAGGITHWAIPTTKLHRNAYRRHTERLAAGGAKYVLNTRVGDTPSGEHITANQIAFEELAEKNDVIFIGTGLQFFNYLPEKQVSREKQSTFVQGIDFLESQNQVLDGRDASNYDSQQAEGQDIVVVGTGDTAWDVVATSLRQDANKITVLVRKNELNGLNQEIIDGGDINVKDKEIRSGLEEAAYIAKQRGVDLRDVLDIRFETEIIDNDHQGGIENLTLKTKNGNDSLKVDKVVLALGSQGHDLKTQFGFTNDTFQMKHGNRLPVTQYYSAEERVDILGKGSGHGGGLVGIYQTESGRKVPVFAVGDVTRDDKELDWSDEGALIVNAYRDGVNILPDAFKAAETRKASNDDEFIQWAEQKGMTLNYIP